MILRRTILAAVLGLLACTPAAEPSPLEPVWLRISWVDSAYQFSVENEIVEQANLEAALVRHATANNPGVTSERVREVPIYVRADPGTPSGWLQDLTPIFERFERVGFVAEDRRS